MIKKSVITDSVRVVEAQKMLGVMIIGFTASFDCKDVSKTLRIFKHVISEFEEEDREEKK